MNGNTTTRRRPFGSVTGSALIAVTYFYFLIFAQFAFLKLLKHDLKNTSDVPWIMACMGLGGIGGSLLMPLLLRRWLPGHIMRAALSGCGAIAVLSALTSGSLSTWMFLSGAIGVFLGAQTVTLVAALRRLIHGHDWAWRIAAGVGFAYWLCNVPWIFQAAPHLQAWFAAAAAFLATLIVPSQAALDGPDPLHPLPSKTGIEPVPEVLSENSVRTKSSIAMPFGAAVIAFSVLIAFDSAAFTIIQQTAPLVEATWGRDVLLWRNGIVHGLMAMLAGWLLPRLRLPWLLAAAFLALGVDVALLNGDSSRAWAGVIYASGVSVYSVCLVAYPAFLSGATRPATVARRAAILYAIAGWIGSGLGVGAVQELASVPPWLLGAASAVLLLALGWSTVQRHRREWLVVLCVLTLSGGLAALRARATPLPPSPSARVQLGHRVYLSEGCIHCHSQYVRPGTQDSLLWGPVIPPEVLMTNRPPLYGNRRHGPDLLQVGNRRSRAWLKEHFLDPQAVRPGSVMPSYAHLFQDDRGENLLDYLQTLGRGTLVQRMETIRAWRCPISSPTPQLLTRGKTLFNTHCQHCHGPDGNGLGPLASKFPRAAGPLSLGRFIYAPATLAPESRHEQLARLIKFGVPGTSMPGHEYLPDSELAALAIFVASWGQGPPP